MGIPVKQLLVTNVNYRAEEMQMFCDLYKGGRSFNQHKGDYLRWRQIERGNSKGGQAVRQARLDAASYTPHSSGIIQWLASSIMQSPPTILASGPETKIEYYHDLNESEPCRPSVEEVSRDTLIDLMLFGRAFLHLKWPEQGESTFRDLGEQRLAGALDAEIEHVCTRHVDDWEEDEDHDGLEWVRIHLVDQTRSDMLAAPDQERHRWIYYTQDRIDTYVAYRPIKNGVVGNWAPNAMAELESSEANGLGQLPIIQLKAPHGIHVMERLADTALSLFNREASLQYALDTSAYSQPFIATKKQISQVLLAETAVWMLDQGDTAGFVSPNPGHFQSISENCTDLREQLFAAVQAMILSSSASTQNPRQSAKAKSLDLGSIHILLTGFANTLKEALEQCVELIADARGDEDVEVSVAGLDQFMSNATESNLALAQTFLAIPGIPPKAAAWVKESISLTMCNDAPADVREEIRKQAQEQEEVEVQAPVVEGAQQEGNEDEDTGELGMMNGKTKEQISKVKNEIKGK